jgi:hypothetical protein
MGETKVKNTRKGLLVLKRYFDNEKAQRDQSRAREKAGTISLLKKNWTAEEISIWNENDYGIKIINYGIYASYNNYDERQIKINILRTSLHLFTPEEVNELYGEILDSKNNNCKVKTLEGRIRKIK